MSDQTSIKIAVVGMACQLPGACNINEYWELVRNGKRCLTTFTDEQLRRSGVKEDLIQNPKYIRTKGILPDIDLFDADFFGFTPKEAAVTDPQHRFFLECAWQALEDAGYDSLRYPGRIGVFGGQSMNDYMIFNILPNIEKQLSADTLQLAIGNDKDSITTKVSYMMDLKGPGVTVQSSSSTSLTAIAIACQNLLCYESDMALAGGVCIGVPQEYGYLYQDGGIISNDGHCRTFDDISSGFVIASGVGVVVLKRLEDAINDCDHIYCVVDSVCLNNDGCNKASYSAPSVEGISNVILDAIYLSGFDPEDIQYIETHGTGTRLGDFLEVKAMKQAYEQKTKLKNYCAIGSVKSNIGHVDTAAGVAGFIKVALCLQHGIIPPHIGMETPNRNIDFIDSPFYINQFARPWITESAKRIAAITSIGMGGTNAHAILSSYTPKIKKEISMRKSYVLILSARTKTSLKSQHAKLIDYLNNSEEDLMNIAYTLQMGRRQFSCRAAYSCQDINEALKKLESYVSADDKMYKKPYKIVYTVNWDFTDESINGFDQLRRIHPLFNKYYQQYIKETEKYVDLIDLKNLEITYNQKKVSVSSLILHFICNICYACLLKDFGLKVDAVSGEQINEFAAAYIAEIFTFKETLLLLCNSLTNLTGHNIVNRELENEIDVQIKGITPKTSTVAFFSWNNETWMNNGEEQNIRYWENICFPYTPKQYYQHNENNVIWYSLNVFCEKSLCDLLSEYWSCGGMVHWDIYQQGCDGNRISLPTYPFDKQRYWIDSVPDINYNKSKPVDSNMNTEHGTEEEIVMDIWKSILGLNTVEKDDNYFELGGNSLLATQIVSSISNRLHVPLLLSDFYNTPTINGLINIIKASTKHDDKIDLKKENESIYTEQEYNIVHQYVNRHFGKRTEVIEIYPLTSSGERMLFQYLFFKKQNKFQQSYVFELTGRIDFSILIRSFYQICANYDTLHSVYSYRLLDKPVQIVLNDLPPEFSYEDLRFKKDYEAILNEYRDNDMKKSFDLLHSAPIRLSVFRLPNNGYKLILSLHHIALDALSFHLITDEFLKCYSLLLQGRQLTSPSTNEYKQYLNWYLSKDRNQAMKYWEKYLKSFNSPCIPLLQEKKMKESQRSECLLVRFNQNEVQRIKEYAKDFRVSENTIYILIWCIVLQLFGNTDELLFGAVVSGRPAELTNNLSIVGMLSNVVPLRVDTKSLSVLSALQKIQQDLMKHANYAEVSLLDIIEATGIEEHYFHYIINIAQRKDFIYPKDLPFQINNIDLHQNLGHPLCCTIQTSNNDLIFQLEYQIDMVDKKKIKMIFSVIRYILLQIRENKLNKAMEFNQLVNEIKIGVDQYGQN